MIIFYQLTCVEYMYMFVIFLQFTEEKLGSAEKTEFDAHFDKLLQRSDRTRIWSEKLLKSTGSLLQPNPSK